MAKSYKDYPFYHGAIASLFKNARILKHESTESEQILWKELKAKRFLGLKFRRQHPIDKFVVDFLCNEYKLIVDVDGGIHNEESVKERDIKRENILRELGWGIIRFSNEEIHYNISSVLEKLASFIKNNSSLSNLEREPKGEV